MFHQVKLGKPLLETVSQRGGGTVNGEHRKCGKDYYHPPDDPVASYFWNYLYHYFLKLKVMDCLLEFVATILEVFEQVVTCTGWRQQDGIVNFADRVSKVHRIVN